MRFKLLSTRNAALIILSVLLAMCLAFGIILLPKTALAEDSVSYDHTYILGAEETDTEQNQYGVTDMLAGWKSATAQKGKVLVQLESDWTLSAFLLVPPESDVTLDLNGHIIDRGLTSATSNGYVIDVVGNLTITDSDPTAGHTDGNYIYNLGTEGAEPYLTRLEETTVTGGIITGGYSSDTVGGIWVAGELTLNGGTIYGNTTTNQYGGGVYVEQYKSFTMNGGAIVKNAVNYYGTNASKPAMGGGVAVYGAGAQFTMSGGLIADNVSKNTGTTSSSDANGGGVEIYGTNANQAKFTMAGGTINNNRTVAYYDPSKLSGAQSVGGAIGVQYAVVDISGGEISDNSAKQITSDGIEGCYFTQSRGSAIGANDKDNSVSDDKKEIDDKVLTISGGTIKRNVAFYGAIYMFGDQEYKGGKIVNNISADAAGIKINDSITGVTSGSTAKTDVHISGTFSFYKNVLAPCNWSNGEAMNVNAVINNIDASIEFPYLDKPATDFGKPENNSHDIVVGELAEGEKRSLFVSDDVLDTDIGVTFGYATNNSNVNGIPINPNKFFENGRPESGTTTSTGLTFGTNGQGKLVLNSEGEVAFTSLDQLVFTVTYSDETSETFDYFDYDNYGTSFTYSEKIITSIKFNDEKIYNAETTDQKINGAGTYKFTVQIGNKSWKTNDKITGLNTIFYVVVLPKEITEDDDNFEVEFEEYNIYDGTEHKPVTSVKYNDIELVENVDYTLSYSNNVSAGKEAEAIFEFTGNYKGDVTVYFTIAPIDTTQYALTWQCFDGEDWVALTDTALVYNGNDQSGRIRAELTTGPNTNIYVYAENGTEQNITNMYLQFTVGGQSVELLNADKYTVTIAGTGNYASPENKTAEVIIAPQEIAFGSLDYEDGEKTRLWQLQFGTSTSNLRDEVTYIDGDGAVIGKEVDAYARFRDILLTIGLNPNYIYDGHPLSYYLNIAEVSYTENSAKGTANTVTKVNTTVTFKFNANYAVSDTTDNTVTLEKTWYIVTINNGLLNSDGSTATLPEFTYGEQTTVQPFKPEHGDTVYFTFSQGSTVLERVAVVYSGELKEYRLFNIVDGKHVLGDVMPDTNYFASVINLLVAGNYQLDVHVNEFTDSDNVVYYAIDRTFNLVVNAYNIKTGETAKRIEYNVTTPEIVFSDSAKAPDVTVTFDGEELVYGVDYTVTTSSVNAGSAVAQVNGIGNFGGSIEVAFEITKADNEWVSAPNIIRWVYGGFNSSINIVTSTPKYMSAQESVAYTVLNSDKNAVSTVLTNFHVEGNGVVTANIATALAQLDSGTYYLVSRLNGTSNYNALDTSANPLEFNVIQATNVWLSTPSVIQWHYNEFDKNVNRVIAVSKYLDDSDEVLYSITTDAEGKINVDGLKEFTAVNGVVADTIGVLLNKLNAGTYYLVAKVGGGNNYSGLNSVVEFSVAKAANDWKDSFDVISWAYGSYDKDVNRIMGTVISGEVTFSVAKDGTAVSGLESFTEVNDTIATILGGLPAGTYTVTAKVAVDGNHNGVADGSATLKIAQAVNAWSETPSIVSWVKGNYNAEENVITASDVFASVVDYEIYETENEENVIYKVENGEVVIDKLAEAGVGHYTLKAVVNATSNYGGLEKTFTFQIFAPEGLAWWAWLLIIVGILGVIALVFFILHEKGVLQMLTGRFVIAMRTKMSVDATIAAVRAHKRAEAAKVSVAEAEARDRRQAFKEATPEEKTAILEQKAQEAQALVEKIQGKIAQVKPQNSVDEASEKEDKGE